MDQSEHADVCFGACLCARRTQAHLPSPTDARTCMRTHWYAPLTRSPTCSAWTSPRARPPTCLTPTAKTGASQHTTGSAWQRCAGASVALARPLLGCLDTHAHMGVRPYRDAPTRTRKRWRARLRTHPRPRPSGRLRLVEVAAAPHGSVLPRIQVRACVRSALLKRARESREADPFGAHAPTHA